MTITERIFITLAQKHLSQKEFARKIDVNEKTVSAWKKNNSLPPLDKISNISDCLGVSIDFLITGQEKATKEELELSENEQELLSIFSQFSEREQIKVIGKVEEWLVEKQRRTSVARPNMQTAYIASRSFDNTPPRIATGDFSDVLNAPDSTDEY